jgi:hypothetical protein
MASKEAHTAAFAHDEMAAASQASHGYTGDHLTKQKQRSAAEWSLVIKAGCLFTTLTALVYFVAYLVNLAPL